MFLIAYKVNVYFSEKGIFTHIYNVCCCFFCFLNKKYYLCRVFILIHKHFYSQTSFPLGDLSSDPLTIGKKGLVRLL